ncbi:MAG: Asp-tRNA(Asn)/Glu-tRNA(Gln) amidotransferase subunit GatB [Candidatus Nanohaloarchaea archaeon]
MTEVKIGLETHVQLDTDTKLFCGCPNRDADEPNKHVCETCLGHPGSKPRLNRAVLRRAAKTAEALQCDLNRDIFFSRKTYFYPDMNKNYQITQYEIPVAEDGEFEVKVGDEKKDVRIQRLHIEEDPAKLTHVGGSIADADYTRVDYNRAGTPLLEIVTAPDFESPEEARAYLQQLSRMLEYLEVYFPGSEFAIKSDANISIEGGARVEVKNITGTAGIEKALSYEISRQKQLTRRGREVEQETRNYNAGMEITEKLREKETEEDYGYIFDPDLTRQEFDSGFRESIREDIPELPHEKFERFQDEYGLPEKMVEALITGPELADDFETLAEDHETELVASWLTGELKKTLNYNEVTYTESGLELEWLGYLLGLLEDAEISDRNAELVLREIVEEPRHPEEVVEEQDLLKAEESEVDAVVDEVIDDNPDAVEDYRSGKEDAVNFLVGQVMQQSGGKADPKTAREKILERIEDES